MNTHTTVAAATRSGVAPPWLLISLMVLLPAMPCAARTVLWDVEFDAATGPPKDTIHVPSSGHLTVRYLNPDASPGAVLRFELYDEGGTFLRPFAAMSGYTTGGGCCACVGDQSIGAPERVFKVPVRQSGRLTILEYVPAAAGPTGRDRVIVEYSPEPIEVPVSPPALSITSGPFDQNSVSASFTVPSKSFILLNPTMVGTNGGDIGVYVDDRGVGCVQIGDPTGPILVDVSAGTPALRLTHEDSYFGDNSDTRSADFYIVTVPPDDCGNGAVDLGEECDDGNLDDSDGCTIVCTVCGDAITAPAEQCDDGNLVDHDGCNANCRLPICGDGVRDPGEQCDDANRIPDDGCTTRCTVCGDRIATPPEECDDGNTIDHDGCSNACAARWVLTGPLGGPQGSPRALAVDPRAPQTLYAAFGGTGVYRTTDGGRTWRKADGGLPGPDANALAVASTGAVYAAVSGGVYTSTDAGDTWESVDRGLPSNPDARVLATDPVTAGTLYAGVDRYGVYKSTDAGQTWRPASAGLTAKSVRALAVAPSTPRTLYVGTESGGTYRSRDAAQSWQAVNTGLEDLAVRSLAVDPTDAEAVYAGTNHAVFKTTDAGGHWVAAANGLPEVAVNALIVDPEMPHTVCAATEGDGVFQTTDGGATWYAASGGLQDRTVRLLALDPDVPETLYAGTGSRLYKTDDAGAQWQSLTGAPVPVNAVVVDPAAPATLYAATGDHPGNTGMLYKSTDRGATWAFANIGLPELPVSDLALDPTDARTIYAGLAYHDVVLPVPGLYKSTDSAGSWTVMSTGLPLARIKKIGIDPTNTRTLYVGTDQYGVYKSVDAGGRWREVNTGITNRDIWEVGFDWSAAGTVYVATSAPLFKTTDGGSLWRPLRGVPEGINALAVDPVDPRIVYTGGNEAVHKTTDAGATWVAANSGLPFVGYNVIAIDPDDTDVLYVGVYFHWPPVFRSTDGGRAWSGFSDGLDGLYSGRVVTIDPSSSHRLYVGTDAGVFTLEQASTTCGDGTLQPQFGEECDDGNTRTGDCCRATCTVEPVDTPCSDANVCNGDETCDGHGTCRPGAVRNCDDGDPGTTDSCDPVWGCQHVYPGGCIGDCNANGAVTINELVTMVNIALETRPIEVCMQGDANRDARITVDELVLAVTMALTGCSAPSPPTPPIPTATPTATPTVARSAKRR